MAKRMIGLMSILLALGLMAVLLPHAARAAGDVKIDANNFPDEGFRGYVSEKRDLDHNGSLSSQELSNDEEIRIYNYTVKSLKGIEFFTEITSVACTNNQLEQADFSKNKKLSSIDLSSNKLTQINLTGLSGLGYLYLSNNKLESIDLTGCTGLGAVNLYNNELYSLDLTKCSGLTIINCSYNHLSALDLSQCLSITNLMCDNNSLKALNVSRSTTLKELSCENNQLASVNVSGCTKLVKLNCCGNKLALLDISKIPNLAETVQTGSKKAIAGGQEYFKSINYTRHSVSISSMTSILTGGNPFTDNVSGKFFFEPVLWAYYHDPQITTGTDTTHFSPNVNCTRGQVVTFLWRAAGCPEPESQNNPFSDVKSDAFYYKAVLWAVENGITTGTKDKDGKPTGNFEPKNNCSRGEVVTFLYRASGSPTVSTAENPFKDIKSGKFYYDAVLWAVENGITTGTKDSAGNPTHKFEPGKVCTRGEVVTFLFRNVTGKQ